MERKRSLRYLRAKKKVEALKGFYGHLTVFIFVNAFLILSSAGLFSSSEMDFAGFEIYFSTILWGIGLLSHGLYVLYIFKVDNNFFKRWEENKIKEIMEKQDDEIISRTQNWE
tara:strand:- start:120318 stop:120656 length:339 start_codon:yes stop_codon:yes gene_type:complete